MTSIMNITIFDYFETKSVSQIDVIKLKENINYFNEIELGSQQT
jgi:hypothetical protein